MEARVGHWRCRYRILGPAAEGEAALQRLQRVAQRQLAGAFDTALDLAFEGDPAVYVLRRLQARVTLLQALETPESMLAAHWSERVSGAVVRAIAHDSGDGANLMRFADQADYVAHFIAALLSGHAWDRWFYAAFSDLRRLSTSEAVLAVLLRNQPYLAAILRHLFRLGFLDQLLASLGPEAGRRLWLELVSQRAAPLGAEAFAPFIWTAVRVARGLELWGSSAPGEDALVAEYLATRPAPPDWTDRRALAQALFQVLRFFAARGYLGNSGAIARQRFEERREHALADLDWLDREWLAAALLSIMTPPPLYQAQPDKRDARRPLLTPTQQALLVRIRDLIAAQTVRLDTVNPDSDANALRLFTALIEAEARWEQYPGVGEIIKRLLLCWKWTLLSADASTLMRDVADRSADAPFELPALDAPPSARDAFESIRSLGVPALDVLRALTASTAQPGPRAAGEVWQSGCAGVFLLIRALLDARLPQVFQAAVDAGALPSFLAAIGVQWGGRIDPGIALWAGLNPTTLKVSDLVIPESDAVLNGLFAMLKRRCGIDTTVARFHEVSLCGRQALVASNAAGDIWPLGCWVDSTGPSAAATFLRKQWHALTGSEPEILEDDTGREALENALADLSKGWPAEVPVNLAVTLAAIAALRLWARWLPGLSGSSAPYLLKNFIRRPGAIQSGERCIEVYLEPGPMDVVLELAGYLREIEDVPWLDHRKVVFHLEQRSPC